MSTLFQQSPKKWWLYSNMKVSTLLQFISILKKYLPYPLNFFCPVTEVECLPYYNIVSVLLKFSVHFIPTPELSAPLQYAVCLIVGTPWNYEALQIKDTQTTLSKDLRHFINILSTHKTGSRILRKLLFSQRDPIYSGLI